MLDTYHRKINYIRISITDKCNLKCIYCKPANDFLKLTRREILSYEEILRLVTVGTSCGISKVRLTGGDPLIRKNLVQLVGSISKSGQIKDLSITTNGLLLEKMAQDLYEAGLHRINISLDSLQREKFKYITGKDELPDVLKGINKVQEIGFSPIKINIVAIRGINDDEICDMAKLSLEYPFHIRFIEFMPIGNKQLWDKKKYIPCLDIKKIINTYKTLIPSSTGGPHHSSTDGPAEMFEFEDAPGKIGFISPMSNHFCSTCNRIRLTADGKVRNCLFSDEEVDIRSVMHEGAGDEELRELLIKSIKNKPEAHHLTPASVLAFNRGMHSIGG